MRSAIARPMPRVEPVMTATFPFMSNRLMVSLPLINVLFVVVPGRSDRTEPGISRFRAWSFGPSRNDDLRQLLHLRPGRLMHRGVSGIRDSWLLVHHRQPPVFTAL